MSSTLPCLAPAAVLSLFAGSCCFLLQSAVAVEEPSTDTMAEIRAEIAAMRAAYETQISALENRVKELEAERNEDRAITAQVQKEADAAQVMAQTAIAEVSQASVAGPSGEAKFTDAQIAQLEETFEKYDVTRGFTFNGYFRAGFGVDEEGNTMPAFKLPDAGAKFRLGNETETYVETAFGYTFPELELPEGTEFSIGFRPSYVVPDNEDSRNSTFSVREAYAMAKGVWEAQPEASFWAGQRFYQRWDVHMSDFYYLDMSGYGGGVEDVAIGDFGKLSAAWVGGSIDDLSGGSEIVDDKVINAKNSIDLRISDIDVPAGTGLIWVNVAHVDDNNSPNGNNVNIEGGGGLAFGLMHEMELEGGYNRAMVQYGFGAAANFRATEPDFNQVSSSDPLNPTLVDYDDIWHFRFVEDIVLKPNEKWSIQAAFVYDLFDAGLVDDSQVEWVSLGVRPIYHFNEYWSLAFEAGVDHTDSEIKDREGELYKVTIAPQITPGRGYFDRPALRFFVTYASWSDEFEGEVAPDSSYSTDTDGITFGIQAEAWW